MWSIIWADHLLDFQSELCLPSCSRSHRGEQRRNMGRYVLFMLNMRLNTSAVVWSSWWQTQKLQQGPSFCWNQDWSNERQLTLTCLKSLVGPSSFVRASLLINHKVSLLLCSWMLWTNISSKSHDVKHPIWSQCLVFSLLGHCRNMQRCNMDLCGGEAAPSVHRKDSF